MAKQTADTVAASAFDRYKSDTGQVESRPTAPPGLATELARRLTAAVTVVSALTIGVFPASATSTAGAAASVLVASRTVWGESKYGSHEAKVNLLMRGLARLKAYKPGWAGPGSKAAAPKALILAGDFIHYLTESGMTAPNKINLSADGEINFYWKRGDSSFDFGIDRYCRSSYYARTENGSEFFQDAKRGIPVLDKKIIEAFSYDVG